MQSNIGKILLFACVCVIIAALCYAELSVIELGEGGFTLPGLIAFLLYLFAMLNLVISYCKNGTNVMRVIIIIMLITATVFAVIKHGADCDNFEKKPSIIPYLLQPVLNTITAVICSFFLKNRNREPLWFADDLNGAVKDIVIGTLAAASLILLFYTSAAPYIQAALLIIAAVRFAVLVFRQKNELAA